jgi:hypothetical protein
MRRVLFLIFVAFAVVDFHGVAHCQPAAVNQHWLASLRDERAMLVTLLEIRGKLFVPTFLGFPAPVARGDLEKGLLLARIEQPQFDSEDAMRQLLRFDRSYRQELETRLTEIERELQAAGVPAAAVPPGPAPPVVPMGGSLFGGSAPSRGLAFDQYIEETRRDPTPPSSTSGALQMDADGVRLLGQPLCTFAMEVIITAGTEVIDRNPVSQSYGRSVLHVPAAAENGFHVQLFHPAYGKMRLSGREARIALEHKGYLVATADGWRGTQVYENFVNYGAGYQRGTVVCAEASPPEGTGAVQVADPWASVLGPWDFGRNKTEHIGTVILTNRPGEHGAYCIDGYKNLNESYWKLNGEDSIVFLHKNGKPTTYFLRVSKNYWEGRFLPPENWHKMKDPVVHYLQRK